MITKEILLSIDDPRKSLKGSITTSTSGPAIAKCCSLVAGQHPGVLGLGHL